MIEYRSLPHDQRHLFANAELPLPPRYLDGTLNKACQGSNLAFPARGPRGIITVYIGERGCLWRMGQPYVDRYDGQLAVCLRGKEAKWVSVNALPTEKLWVLSKYANCFAANDPLTHHLYVEELFKSVGPVIMADKVMEAGNLELLAEIIELEESLDFLRKMERTPTYCEALVSDIYRYLATRTKREAVIPEPVAVPESEPTPEPTPELVEAN